MLTEPMARKLQERATARTEAAQALEDAIVEAYKAGGTLSEIAREIGWSHVGISRLLERLGVRKRWRIDRG